MQGKEASIIKTEADESFMRFIEATQGPSESAKSLKVAIDGFFAKLTTEQQTGCIEYARALQRMKTR